MASQSGESWWGRFLGRLKAPGRPARVDAKGQGAQERPAAAANGSPLGGVASASRLSDLLDDHVPDDARVQAAGIPQGRRLVDVDDQAAPAVAAHLPAEGNDAHAPEPEPETGPGATATEPLPAERRVPESAGSAPTVEASPASWAVGPDTVRDDLGPDLLSPPSRLDAVVENPAAAAIASDGKHALQGIEDTMVAIAALVERDGAGNPGAVEASSTRRGLAVLLQQLRVMAAESKELLEALNDQADIRSERIRSELVIGLRNRHLPYGEVRLKPPRYGALRRADISETGAAWLMLRSLTTAQEARSRDAAPHPEARRAAKAYAQKLRANGHDPLRVALNPDGVDAYRWLVGEAGDHRPKLHARLLTRIMSDTLLKHRDLLEAKRAWLDSGTDPKLKPDFGPLMSDVWEWRKTTDRPIEDIPTGLDAKQREVFSAFLPALDSFFRDQVESALLGHDAQVPLSGQLRRLQAVLDASPDCETALKQIAELIPPSMERMYATSHVVEHAATRIAVAKGMSEKDGSRYPTFQKRLQFFASLQGFANTLLLPPEHPVQRLFDAKNFRNDVAHSGRIWGPDDFPNACVNYEQGIVGVSQLFGVPLSSIILERKTREGSSERPPTSRSKSVAPTAMFSLGCKALQLSEEQVRAALGKDFETEARERIRSRDWQLSSGAYRHELSVAVGAHFAEKHMGLKNQSLISLLRVARALPRIEDDEQRKRQSRELGAEINLAAAAFIRGDDPDQVARMTAELERGLKILRKGRGPARAR